MNQPSRIGIKHFPFKMPSNFDSKPLYKPTYSRILFIKDIMYDKTKPEK